MKRQYHAAGKATRKPVPNADVEAAYEEDLLEACEKIFADVSLEDRTTISTARKNFWLNNHLTTEDLEGLEQIYRECIQK